MSVPRPANPSQLSGEAGERSSPWAVLHDLLARTLGHVETAKALSSALSAAAGHALPTSPGGVAEFAREHLVPVLAAAHGRGLADALAESWDAELAELPEGEGSAGTPLPTIAAPEPRVASTQSDPGPRRSRMTSVTGEEGRPVAVIAGGDPLHRATLARMLVTAGFDVRPSVADLRASDDFRVALVNIGLAGLREHDELLRALLASRSNVPVLVRTAHADPKKGAGPTAQSLGLPGAEVFDSGVPLSSVVARACEVAGLVEAAERTARNSFERMTPEAMRRVPELAVQPEDLGWFEAPAEDLAVLRAVDGSADLQAIADRCGLPGAEVVRIVSALVAEGLVRLG